LVRREKTKKLEKQSQGRSSLSKEAVTAVLGTPKKGNSNEKKESDSFQEDKGTSHY